jgi:hypothetical protein
MPSIIAREHVEALALVLDERVALAHRRAGRCPPQVVHLVEVLAPLAVEHREQHAALELAHDLSPSSASRASYAAWASP